MARNKIYEVDMDVEDTEKFDSSFTSSILSTNMAGFSSTFMIGLGAIVALAVESPKGLVRVASRFLANLLKRIADAIIRVGKFICSIVNTVIGFGRMIGHMFKSLWKFIKRVGGIIASVYKFFKTRTFKEAMSDIWKGIGKGFTDTMKKWGDFFTLKYNKGIAKINDIGLTISKNWHLTKLSVESSWKSFQKSFTETWKGLKTIKITSIAKSVRVTVAAHSSRLITSLGRGIGKTIKGLLKSLKNGLHGMYINVKYAPARNFAKRALSDKVGWLSKHDKSIAEVLAKATKKIDTISGWKAIRAEQAIQEKLIKETLSQSSAGWVKVARKINLVSNAIPLVGDVAGFLVGSVIDSIDMHNEGNGWFRSIGAAVLGNLAGSVIGVLADIASPFALAGAPVVFAGGIALDAYVTDRIEHWINPTHDKNATFNAFKELGGASGKLGKKLFEKVTGAYGELVSDQEYVMDTNAMTNNLNGYEADFAKNVSFTNLHLSELIHQKDAIPTIDGVAESVSINGEVQDPGDEAGDSSEENVPEDNNPYGTLEIPYPGYLLTGFLKNVKNISTKDAAKGLDAKYTSWNDMMKVYATQLRVEIADLKEQYRDLGGTDA